MINIYSPFNTTYNNNGNATLVPIYCTQKVAINGVWQVVMEHPYDKEGRWQLIENEAVIKIESTAVEYTDNKQLYRIYKVERGLHSVYCEALPIALDAFNEARVMSIKADNKTGTEFASVLNQRFSGYTITSNINTLPQTAEWKNTNLIEILNGGDNCFVKLYGGEIKYDNTKISINSRLDSNPANFKLRLGRDIEDIKYAVDDTDVVTRIYPLSASGGYLNKQTEYAIGAERYVDSPLIGNYPKIHNEFVKTDYVLCTTKADSKDPQAYGMTMDFHADIKVYLENDYATLVDRFLHDELRVKGNVEYLQALLKKTKKKDGYSGIIEICEKLAVAGCINSEWKKIVISAVDEALDFIDDLAEPDYKLESQGVVWEEIVSGIGVYKGLHEDKIYFNSTYTCTKFYALVEKDDGTREHKLIWEGSKTGTFSIDIKLPNYLLRQYRLFYTNDGEKHVDFTYADLKYVQYQYSDTNYGVVREEWHYVEGRWHYFDESGYMHPLSYAKDNFDWVEATVAVDDHNVKYKRYGSILNPYGISFMHNQWAKMDGGWYYFKDDGTAYKSKDLRTEIIEGLGFKTETDSYALTIKGYEEDLYQKLYQRLTDYAEYLYSEGVDKPRITLDVSQVDLNNIVGYSGLPTLKLGHNVQIDFNGLTATERIVEIEYDCVTKRNKTLTIGAPSETITAMINRKVDVGNGLVAGEGVSIEGNVITVEGGGDSGGGGGSEVVVTPKHRQSYYNIADISVDGVVKHLYGGMKWWKETSSEIYQESIKSVSQVWGCKPNYYYSNPNHGKIWFYRWVNQEIFTVRKNLYHEPPHWEGEPVPETSPEHFAAGIATIPDEELGGTMEVFWQLSDERSMARIHDYWHSDTDSITISLCGGTVTMYLYYHAYHIYDEEECIEYSVYEDKNLYPPVNPNGETSGDEISEEDDLYIRNLAHCGHYENLQDFFDNILIDIEFRLVNHISTGMAYDQDIIFWGGELGGVCANEQVSRSDYPFTVDKNGNVNSKGYYCNYEIMPIDVKIDSISAKDENGLVKINTLKGATDSEDGEKGLAPAPQIADRHRFLRGDGTWAEAVSDISVTPSLDDGVKIAEIEVDGVTEEIYAPTGTKTIAYRSITPTAYEALSSAEKNNGTIYLVSENADGSMGFFVQYRNMTESDYNALSTSEKNNGTMYLLSNNADNSMGINFSEINMNDTVVCLIGGLNGNNNV